MTGWWGFLLEPRETTSRPRPGRVEKVVPIESQNVTNRTENWVLLIQGWQLISDLTFCDSCANWVAALWRFGAEAPSPHPDALRSCWLFWLLLTQQLIESIIHNNLIDWCWGSSSHTQGWVKKEMLGTCSRVCFTLSMSLVREASTEKISRICCWASISGLRGPPSLISTLIGGFEGSISYCFICI